MYIKRSCKIIPSHTSIFEHGPIKKGVWGEQLTSFAIWVGIPCFFMEYKGTFRCYRSQKFRNFTARIRQKWCKYIRQEKKSYHTNSTAHLSGKTTASQHGQCCHSLVEDCHYNIRNDEVYQRTFLYGRVCVYTALSPHLFHRAHSSVPEFHPHLQSHFYLLQPLSTAVPLDTGMQKKDNSTSLHVLQFEWTTLHAAIKI